MSTKILPLTSPNLLIRESVAVVGSSSVLLESEYGYEIDSFEEVVRFNRAPTEGWSNFVGKKTTLRVVNPHVFASKPYANQDQYFIRKQKNCQLVVIGPENQELKFENHTKFIDNSCETYKVDISRAYQGFRTQPTVGMCFISLLVRAGIKPTLYGFYGIPGKQDREGLTHYWHERTNQSVCHNYQSERDILKSLHEQDLINWIK